MILLLVNLLYCLTVALPEITKPPADMEVTAGDTLHLRCVISRSLRPYTTVWWLHNAVPVTGSITGKSVSGSGVSDLQID